MKNLIEQNFLNNKVEVFIINLKRDQQKKNKMIKMLKNFSFNFFFVEAIDGLKKKEISEEGYCDLKRRLFLGRSLLDKELAIMESHVKAIKLFSMSKSDYGLILEDDILIPEIFEQILNKIIALDYDFDLIRFINKPKFRKLRGRIVASIDQKYSLIRLPKLPGGAYSYLLSKKGANKLLDMTSSYYHPIDILMGQTWKKNLNSLFCSPGMIEHPPVPEHVEINDPRYVKENKKIISIYAYTRMFFKFYEVIMKWAHFWVKFPGDFKSRTQKRL